MVAEQQESTDGGDVGGIAWDWLIAGFVGYLTAIGRPATTIELRRWQMRNLAASLGKPAHLVTAEDLLAVMAEHPWKPETRKSMRAAMRGFFGWAHRFGHVPEDPSQGLPGIAVPKAQARPCPDATYRAALAAADEREQLMLRLAREAGLRRAEIAQVHVRDLLPGPSLLVHGKGAKQRQVPITEGLAERIGAATGWVFPSPRGGHLAAISVGKTCSALLGPEVTLHMLRHSFATAAYRGSRNLRAVQKLLGHASLAVTERYLATNDDEMRQAMMCAAAA